MRRRLLLVLVGTVALVLLVHDVPLASHLERVERDRVVTGLERDAFTLAGRTEEALEGGTAADSPLLAEMVEAYSLENDVRVVVVDRDANAVIVSDPDGVAQPDFSNRPEIVAALTGDPATGERDSVTLGERLFFVAVPVLSGEEIVGAIRLSAPADTVSDAARSRVRGLLVVALISLLIATVVALVLAGTVTGPLRRLRSTTQQPATGDLTARAETGDGPGEVRDLASSFNAMADRLQQLVEQQRAFAGTASHQLRTPLTALRLRLEHVRRSITGDETAAADVDDAIAETDRLHRMIEGLLTLSRIEGSLATPVVVDLSTVLEDRAAYWAPLADERGVDLIVRSEPGRRAVTTDGAVEQIVDNLVDNALEVAPTGSVIELAVHPTHDGLELHVVDQGPGLSDDEREIAFDRFWRADDATPGGSGLGLAVVRQLAVAAGGGAVLRPNPTGRGIDAVVTFRAAPA
jgi:signal transduction histidine kinase